MKVLIFPNGLWQSTTTTAPPFEFSSSRSPASSVVEDSAAGEPGHGMGGSLRILFLSPIYIPPPPEQKERERTFIKPNPGNYAT